MAKRFPRLGSNQSYSSLLEPTLPKVKLVRKQQQLSNSSESNVHFAIHNTPPRRCFQTSKVLPSAYMIKFTLTGPDKGEILTPSMILHPRFEKKLSGKGAWIICKEEAIALLGKKGSYKRLSPSVSLPKSTTIKIQSQLSRRVCQELILLSERLKSEPSLEGTTKKKRECIIEELKEVEWNNLVSSGGSENTLLEREGMRLEVVISLAPPSTSTLNTPLVQHIPLMSPSTTSDSSNTRQILFYSLYPFLSSAVLPFSSPLSSSSMVSSTLVSSPTPLIEEIKRTLESCISLFQRRNLRIGESKEGTKIEEGGKQRRIEKKPLEELGDYYAFYSRLPSFSPNAVINLEGSEASKMQEEMIKEKKEVSIDLNPLLIALWRCTLWTGEGWEVEKKK